MYGITFDNYARSDEGSYLSVCNSFDDAVSKVNELSCIYSVECPNLVGRLRIVYLENERVVR